jgi:hypothetical protein
VALLVVGTGCQGSGEVYGDEIILKQTTDLMELVKNPGDYSGKELLVSGTVARVCQERGCWLALDADKGEELIVRFKDYAFFVPKDLSGKKVKVQGVFRAEVEEGHLHESDEGGEHECPVGIFNFTASAVEVI